MKLLHRYKRKPSCVIPLFKRLEWQSAYVAIVSTVCVFVRAMWTHASARRHTTTFTLGRRRNITEQFGRDVLVQITR
jgi:hypothetical protein